MIFHARYRRALSRIEAELCQADPGLAAQFERFNWLAATSSRAGGRIGRRPDGRRFLALVLLPLAAVIALWMIVSLSSGNGAGGCAIPLGSACPPGRPGCGPAGAAAGSQPADVPPPVTFRFAEAGRTADAGAGAASGSRGVASGVAAGAGADAASARRVPAGAGGHCRAHRPPSR